VFKHAEIIFGGALLFFLAGCATTPEPDETMSSSWVATNAVVLPPNIPPVTPPALPPVSVINQPPVARTNPPPVKPAKPGPLLTWTSLNRWAVGNQLAAPRKLTSSPLVTYAITSPNGTLVLAIGSREATWNGVELHLGFAPEIIDGQVFLYGIDLQKSVEPLLCGGPPAFGPNRVVVIDPGHGGIKGGTISVLDKRAEKEFTLDLARRLIPLLENNGWRVYLTRTNDWDVALSNRVNFAEARHADLFISLHFNSAAPDKRQAGLETYCLTPTGLPSTLTRNYADVWMEHYPNNAFDEANLQYAVRLHTALLRQLRMEDRGVRRARFMDVLTGQRRPAVLIEGGYLSNPTEAAKIENPEYRQRLAAAIAEALK